MLQLKVWAFKITMIKMLKVLLKKVTRKIRQVISAEREQKEDQLQMLKDKNVVTDRMLSAGSSIGIPIAQERIGKPDDRELEIIQTINAKKKLVKKTPKQQTSIQELWYNSKQHNRHVIGILEEERKQLKKYLKK